MVKKHIHHFNRGLVIGFEALGLAAVALFAGWLFLIIRLTQGPMNVDFLTNAIEAGLHRQHPGFKLDVGSTVLTWGGAAQPFIFEMGHVQITRDDNTPVLSIEKIGVQLYKRYLVFGAFMPRAIRIYTPALRVIRGEDGHFKLNVSEAETVSAEVAPETTGQTDFMKSLFVQMQGGGAFGFLGGLEQVSVTDAAFLYEDKVLNVSWKSRNSDIKLTRGRGGLVIDAITNVEMSPDRQAYVRGSMYYSWQTHRPNGVVYFTSFNPSLLAQQSEQLKALAGIDLALKGSVSFEMDQDFKLAGPGRFVMGADAGHFDAFGLYTEPLAVKKMYMQGRFNASTREALLEQFRVESDDARLDAAAEVKKQADGHLIRVKALLRDMPMDRLKHYWPEKLAPDPRAWVTEHLSAGTASQATLDMTMLAPQGDFGHATLKTLGGNIDFNGIKVDYFAPLMPVTKVSGKATYDEKSFHLDLKGGTLGDMQVLKSKIAITDLDVQSDTVHSKIDIAVSLNGPLQTALQVLDKKPLQYPRALGIQAADVEGHADVEVGFRFPLYTGLTLPEVEVEAHARLKDVLLKNVVSDFSLAGGPMDLALDGGALTLKGEGRLGGMPVTFDWLKNFSPGAKIAGKIEATLPLDAQSLVKLGVPADFNVTGTLPAKLVYTSTGDDAATLIFKGDITPTAFAVPAANYEKQAGLPGTLDFLMKFKGGNPAGITGLTLATEGALLKGDLVFGAGGKIVQKASFSQAVLGATDIALEAEHRDAEGYRLMITGRQFDVSKMLGKQDKPNSDEEAARPVTPVTVSMAVDRLLTGKDKHVERMKMFMRRNGWGRLEQLEVDGVSGARPLYLRYMPVVRGHTLRFEAGNAGAALSAFGITEGVRGGKVVVHANPNPKGGLRDMGGLVSLTDFSLVNVPALGMLLNAMSLTGIVELLNGQGIAFKKMRAEFFWVDKGQPETAKNVRSIIIRGGETSGASLGLTFEGNIDNWMHVLDMSGTIIPVSDLNKLVGIIPLVGNILTGGGKGVFAATYVIKGPQENPTVTVNPLAVLAPGIFRKLFFEK